MGIVVQFPRHARASAEAESVSAARGPSQSSAPTAPPLNALIASTAAQSGRIKRLRYRLTLTRERPIASATASSESSRAAMKSDRCMGDVVHRAHNFGQADCTPGVVSAVGDDVHHVYMRRLAR